MPRDKNAAVRVTLSHFGIRSTINRAVDERVDAFVGDQYLFLEILRGEVLRDVESSPAAVMLRVSRAVNNSTLQFIYDRDLAVLTGESVEGKRAADMVEAFFGALVLGGEYESASRLAQALYQRGARIPNFCYPASPLARTDLGSLSATAADAVGILLSRVLVAGAVPSVRDLHAGSQMLAELIRPVWRGTRKRPSEWCCSVVAALVERGVGEALQALATPFSQPEILLQVQPAPAAQVLWDSVSEGLKVLSDGAL